MTEEQNIEYFYFLKWEFRLVEKNSKWYVEYPVKVFWRKEWFPLITYAGLNQPYPFKSKSDALDSIVNITNIVRNHRQN